MRYPDIEKNYIDDIFMEFSVKCNKEIYFDEDFPIDIHFYMNYEKSNKIIMDIYYDANNIYADHKLNNIQNSLENLAKQFDMQLLDAEINNPKTPKHKIGGRDKEHTILDNIIDGKKLLKYRFIIKPDYTLQKHMN